MLEFATPGRAPGRRREMRHRIRWAALLLFALAGLGGCALLPGAESAFGVGEPAAEASFGGESGIAYEVAIEGAAVDDLERPLREASFLVALNDRPPASLAALQRRAEEDAERLDGVLRSRGFYAGRVTPRIEGDRQPVRVVLDVRPGTVYLLAEHAVSFSDGAPPPSEVPDLEKLGLHVGMFAEAAPIDAARDGLVRHLRDNGYPQARVRERRVRVDHHRTLVEVELAVEPGRRAAFGPVAFAGLKSVDASYLRRLVPWKAGEIYSADRLEDYRRALLDTGLFASARTRLEGEPDGAGRVPVRVEVVEAEHRSIGAGADYSTSEGPGGKLFWEHRNLFGANERVRFTARGNAIEQSLESEFRKPAFRLRDQQLVARNELQRHDSDAFEQMGVGFKAGLERRTAPYWKTGTFGLFELAKVRDPRNEQLSKLFGAAASMERDSTDNLLDPTRGSRLGLFLTPYVGHGDKPLLFGIGEARGSVYRRIDEGGRAVAAARARLGTVVGEDRLDLPANKRFYAGGGGSIRGYEYQTVGPLDEANEPTGGRSILEVGAEVRLKLTDAFGLVPFVEAGQAFDGVYPDLAEDLQWAGGLGLRYYSPVGPLRLDLAVPFNRRRDVDESFQIYVSLGQAF